MNAETLSRFERLAMNVLNQTDEQQRLNGLKNLCRQMQSSEPTLFDIAEKCGVGQKRFSYEDFTKLSDHKDEISYFIEAKDYFDTYDKETPEQAEEREEKCKEVRGEYYSSKWKQTDENGVNTWMVGGYNRGNRVTFEEKWVYMGNGYCNGEYKLGGYYSVWYEYRDSFLYRLCMGLIDASYSNITQQERDVLRLYPIEWESIGLPEEFEERRGERVQAEQSINAATEKLNTAIHAVYLWWALRTEKAELEDYLSLYQSEENEPFTIDPRLTTPKAKAMFAKFAELGYIEMSEGKHWKWRKNKYSLKCFADHAIEVLDLRKNRMGFPLKTWGLFEDLFNETRLQSYKPIPPKEYNDDNECRVIIKVFAISKF